MNTFKLDQYYLVEDSVNEEVYEAIRKKWSKKIELLFNAEKKGQIKSIVDTYKKIKTCTTL